MIADWQKERIERMAAEGRTIVQICKELDLEWRNVSQFLEAVDKKSWSSAKKVITNRLNRLKIEQDDDARKKLAEDAAKWIDYLYEDGKRLGDQAAQARKEMDSASKALDIARRQLEV